MSFVLVSLEGKGSVQVPQGQTVLGRGSFLKVTDRRVSRCHAVMDNVDGRLSIKSTHVNPCFVSSRPLQRDCWFTLQPGDVFSLLPGHFLYRVEIQTSNFNQATPRLEGEESEEEAPPTAEPLMEAHFKIKAPQRKRVLPAWMMKAVRGQRAVKKQTPSPVTSPVEAEPQTSDFIISDNVSNQSSANSTQSLFQTQTEFTQPSETHGTSTSNSTNIGNSTSSSTITNTGTSTSTSNSTNTGNSTSTSNSTNIGNSTSTNIGNSTSTNTGTSTSNSTHTGNSTTSSTITSTVTSASTSNSTNTGNSTTTSTGTSTSAKTGNSTSSSTGTSTISSTSISTRTKTRTPCQFGTNCYRKNPLHFQDFSHPGDSDFEEEEEEEEEEERPQCPYGLQCYRKNPLHRKQYTHTSGRARVSRHAKKVEYDDDDEDYEDEDSFSGTDSDYIPQEEDD